MSSILKYIVSISLIFILASGSFAAEAKKEQSKSEPAKSSGGRTEGGAVNIGSVRGPGTEAALFDDSSLITTPVPTVTPIYSIKGPDKEAWRKLVDTKSLIIRCKKDLPRYEKSFRKDFMDNLNSMGTVVSSIHTEALLDKRDQVEFAWENEVDKAEHTLALAEEWDNEFKEDYKQMEKNQSRVEKLLSKFKAKIQQPGEVESKYEANKEEMFFLDKDIRSFDALFNNYVSKYQNMIRVKEDKENKLLNDHYELYKP